MTRFSNCETAIRVNIEAVEHTLGGTLSSPETRVEWSREHARCMVCGIPAILTETTDPFGALLIDWHCPIHQKQEIEIDWDYIDSFFGIAHVDLVARPGDATVTQLPEPE